MKREHVMESPDNARTTTRASTTASATAIAVVSAQAREVATSVLRARACL
jgi:hypothetical protein